ncbi:MAG: hypothetical protein IJK23_12995 [Clostridia bacterium]|nr:hypothetical protein [Clostridia bacterium]
MSISLDMLINTVYLPGFAATLIANRFWRYKYGETRSRSLIYIVVMIGFGFWGSYLGAYFYNWVHNIMGIQGYFKRTIFGTIITVVVVVLLGVEIEKLIRRYLREKRGQQIREVSLRDTYDLLQPGAIILILTTKVRCLVNGCCFGVPCAWGPYSHKLQTNVFPVQHIEILISALILFITYKYIHTKSYRRGAALFFSGGLWCIGRFFLEYRIYYGYDPEREFFGHFTFWQCACVLIIAVCAAVIVFLYIRYPAEPRPKTFQKAMRDAQRADQKANKTKKRRK